MIFLFFSKNGQVRGEKGGEDLIVKYGTSPAEISIKSIVGGPGPVTKEWQLYTVNITNPSFLNSVKEPVSFMLKGISGVSGAAVYIDYIYFDKE